MANLTIPIDDGVLRKALMKALDQGTSVNSLLRKFPESFTGMDGTCAYGEVRVIDPFSRHR